MLKVLNNTKVMQMKLLAVIIRLSFKLIHSPKFPIHSHALSIELIGLFEILPQRDKKTAFKCPWENCNFVRHEWSNHTVEVYHYKT